MTVHLGTRTCGALCGSTDRDNVFTGDRAKFDALPKRARCFRCMRVRQSRVSTHPEPLRSVVIGTSAASEAER